MTCALALKWEGRPPAVGGERVADSTPPPSSRGRRRHAGEVCAAHADELAPQRVHELLGVTSAEAEGRLDDEHVVVRPVDRGEDAVLVLEPRAQPARLGGRGLAGRSLAHKLDADEEACAAHVPDDGAVRRLLRPQRLQRRPQPLPRCRRVCSQPVPLDRLEDGQPRCRANRVAAERVEIFWPVRKGIRHPPRGDDRGERHPVPHRLAHRHDVRHHPLLLEPPPAGAEAAEPGLHFVRYADAARSAHCLVAGGEVPGGREDHARDRHARLDEEGAHATFALGGARLCDRLCVPPSCVGTAVRAAEQVGRLRHEG
mmetsp:Transcript_26624/g.85388  ORF Transcript_26624/g.85388 Transcript_26624/m.85388 type:complete len:314 (-) Transcript_26624:808-1749(-)